jgi:hypothetical protein
MRLDSSVSFPRFGRMAMASLALATAWSSGRVATSDDLGDLGFAAAGAFWSTSSCPISTFPETPDCHVGFEL